MPPMRIADVKTVRANRPQASILSSIAQNRRMSSNGEQPDDESDTNTQEYEGMSSNSKTPNDLNEKLQSFNIRNGNDRVAVKQFIIKKGVCLKDGTSTHKAKLVAKEDRFDQLKLWRDEKMNDLESRKNNSKGSAKSLYPEHYVEEKEEAWLRKTFSHWLLADPTSTMGRPNASPAASTHNIASVRGQYDDDDEDDEETIPIKTEFPEHGEGTYLKRPPQRNAAKSAIESGNMRDWSARGSFSSPSESEATVDAPRIQQSKLPTKRKRRAGKAHGLKWDEDAASDSDHEYMQQPPKKYVAIGPNDYSDDTAVSKQVADSTEGNTANVVKRAWRWNDQGRLVIDPPLHGW